VGLAGILARGVVRGERTLLEALHEMEVWVNSYTEKVIGDPLDTTKAMRKVLEFVRKDVAAGRMLPPAWSTGMTSEELKQYQDELGQDVEEWGVPAYVVAIADIAMKIPADDIAARDDAVDKILTRMSKSQHLNELSKSTLLKQIQQCSGKMISFGALNKRLKELAADGLQGENHTELAEALLAELEREGPIRFHLGVFFRWMGANWQEIEEHEIHRVLAKEFGGYAAARRFSDHRGIISILQKLTTKPLRTDETPGVNFANGYLTTDMQLLNHDPAFGCTYVLPYRYTNESRLPLKFLGVLDRCWGMEEDFAERVQALREMIAATLFGVAYRYSRAFALVGLSHSGKSTIIDTVTGLIPRDATCTIPPDKWAERFSPVMMAGKLMNFGGELSDDRLIPGQAFKLIVEGQEITGERKNQQPFMFQVRAAHWFGGNCLPRSRDNSGGFTRRWLILDFNHRMPYEDRAVRYHEEILAEEREDLVAWALPAIQDLLARADYTLPACHARRVAEVAATSNSVRAWMESSKVVVVSGVKTLQKALYDDYFAFSRVESHIQPYSVKRFQAAMEEIGTEMGFKVYQLANGDWEYQGLTLERLQRKAA
jgi:P4 family phage/plasmid primase-like protien